MGCRRKAVADPEALMLVPKAVAETLAHRHAREATRETVHRNSSDRHLCRRTRRIESMTLQGRRPGLIGPAAPDGESRRP